MSQKEAIHRHHLIIQQLRKKPSSFAEIDAVLQRASELDDRNYTVSQRTLKRDMDDILSLYNLEIEFDFSSKVYCLKEDDNNNRHQEKMLEAYDMLHALKLSNGYANIVQYEDRNPQGTEHMHGIIHAIKNKLQIRFTYQRFWEDKVSQRTIEPYFLKQFEFRWYVIGWDNSKNDIRTFGLDRISNLEILTEKYRAKKQTEANNLFKHCYGIIVPENKKVEEVILSFDSEQGKYIKSLPLHHSQQILIDTTDELRLQLSIYITDDFIMKLLSYGDEVQVLQPQSLVEKMKEIFECGAKMYQ